MRVMKSGGCDGAGSRWVVGEDRLECGGGELVVVPPNTIHGMAFLDDDTECEVIGELQIGEWITVLDRRQP
jgi:hypothetical protein